MMRIQFFSWRSHAVTVFGAEACSPFMASGRPPRIRVSFRVQSRPKWLRAWFLTTTPNGDLARRLKLSNRKHKVSVTESSVSLVFAYARIMTINVLVNKTAFKKKEKYTNLLSKREANTRKLVHRTSISKKIYSRESNPGSPTVSLTTTLRRWLHATLKNFHSIIIDFYSDFYNKEWR